METTLIKSLDEMNAFAAATAAGWTPRKTACVIGLAGDLGSGKTAFVKGVAQALGVEEHVTSPTFVIQKTYPTARGPFKRLVHVDAYRLDSAHEIEQLDWKTTLADADNLVLIEWPERVASAVPAAADRLAFEFVNETTRSVTR